MATKERPKETVEFLKTNGLCRGSDPDLFYSHEDDDIARAKAICAGCKVVEMCAEYGIEYEDEGVWGGLDEAERRRIRRQGRLAAS